MDEQTNIEQAGMPDEGQVNENIDQNPQDAGQDEQQTELQAQEEAKSADKGKPDAEKLAKDNARMARALERLQKQLAEAKGEPSQKQEAPAVSQPDELSDIDDSEEIEWNGTIVSKEFARRMQEMQERTMQLEQKLSAIEQERAMLEQQQLQQELADAVIDMVTGIREYSLPSLPDESTQVIDKLLVDHVEQQMTKKLAEGAELTPDLIREAATGYLDTIKNLFGVMGKLQIESNTEYKAGTPVKPDGVAGTPKPGQPKTLDERNRLIAERTRLAEELSSK